METILRKIALFLRQRSEQKQEIDLLRQFEEWRLLLQQFPEHKSSALKLAIVRLDDIGDYLLFRNFLSAYKTSEQFKEYKITLIGNIVWKPIFEAYDANAVDATIWLDKNKYHSELEYRMSFWQQIRAENFETIICPSRTRPLLLDDSIALASGAKNKIACHNSFAFADWNKVSDRIYTTLFPANLELHEFFFNKDFAQKISAKTLTIDKPFLPESDNTIVHPMQVLCFIGASAKSKTWPLNNWIELLQLLQQNGYEPLLSGGKNEMEIAAQIIAAIPVKSIAGQTNLTETLLAIANSTAVITGDTMAAHASVSFNKPTVILANGVNAKRFVAYEEAGFKNVKTVYTRQYTNSKKDTFYRAVTKDMESIKPKQILEALQKIV